MKRALRVTFATIGIAAGVGAGLYAYLFASSSIGENELSTWLSSLDDGKAINSLYLPGTHDSLANYALGDLSGKCQELSLQSQLNVGARFLDLRYKVDGTSLKSAHGIVDERTYFKDDAKTIEDFLRSHPKEFVFVSIKNEGARNPAFEDNLRSCIDDSIWNLTDALPQTVAEARGKAYLLSRYDTPTIGYDCSPAKWGENVIFDIGAIHIQDHYKVAKVDEKKQAIEEGFSSGDKFNLHFFSGYLDPAFPPSSAVNVAKEINPWVREALDKPNSNGVAILDFLTTSLAKEIVGRNK